MEQIREVEKSFCILSVAYIVLAIVLLIWPDLSVRTFCYVFGLGMIIFGGAYLIMYFTKDRFRSVMQPDLVFGVVALATGLFVLVKMEYVLEIIPFAMGIVALLGAIVKVQDALDLKRLGSHRWSVMLVLAVILAVIGVILILNPFDEQQKIIVILTGVSLLLDGTGNLIGIFWIGMLFKRLNRVSPEDFEVTKPGNKSKIIDGDAQETTEKKNSKVVGSNAFARKKAQKEGKLFQALLEEKKDNEDADTREQESAQDMEEQDDYIEIIPVDDDPLAMEGWETSEQSILKDIDPDNEE